MNAAALAALANNPAFANNAALQQRMATLGAFNQMNNPMMAALLTQNPMLMQQFWNQLVTPRLPQQQQQSNSSSSSNNTNSNSTNAMAALLQAAQQSQQQHQSGRASNGDSNQSNLNNLFAASLAQMNAGNLMNNPTMLRQFQLLQQVREQMSAKSGGGGNKK